MPAIFLNSNALVKFTNKLEQLSHTAMPNIVRKTINDAALDVKQVTMPNTAKVFKHRAPNFWSSNSRVEFAKNTHNINDMQSTVGFTETRLKIGTTNFAVKDLVEQEYGGQIGGRSFIPMDAARTGSDGVTKGKFRLSEILPLVKDAKDFPGRNDKEKFTKAAIFVGKGGFVIGTGIDHTLLFQITGINKKTKGQKGWITKTPLFRVKAHRVVSVGATNFMSKASFETQNKLEDIYIKNAKARIEKELS